MKIISCNIRGSGSRKKRRTVKEFLKTVKPDIVMLQETKKETCDRRFVGSVWNGRDVEWAVLPACGSSGSIVIIWDSSKFKCSDVVLGSFSVTVKLCSEEEGSFWLTLVYGPNISNLRKDLWEELQVLFWANFSKIRWGLQFHKKGL